MKKIEQFDVALRLAGFNFQRHTVELIINLYELVKQKQDAATIKDVSLIIEESEQQQRKKK